MQNNGFFRILMLLCSVEIWVYWEVNKNGYQILGGVSELELKNGWKFVKYEQRFDWVLAFARLLLLFWKVVKYSKCKCLAPKFVETFEGNLDKMPILIQIALSWLLLLSLSSQILESIEWWYDMSLD